MKKRILTAIAIITAVTASAQISAFRQGTSTTADGYTLPRTVVTVKIIQEREIIQKGPYARFASQFLGIVNAPMSDKDSYRIESTELSYYEEPDASQTYSLDTKLGATPRIFQWIGNSSTPIIDANNDPESAGDSFFTAGRVSATEKSTEAMAAEAADVIYRIRKKRIELITGDLGEGAYGAGLGAALNSMDKLEAEYLTLFIGTRRVERRVQYFTVVPSTGSNRQTACRFSDSKGVVAASDLSGRPINVEYTAEALSNSQPATAAKKGSRTVTYRIPLMVIAKLTDGQEVLSTQRIPIFQMGATIDVPVV